jgi:outer membrane protein assembly factor BamB
VSAPPTADVGVMSGALVDADGNYAVGTPDDEVLLLNVEGAVTHRVRLGGDVDSAPVLVRDGLLAVGCDDGDVYLIGDSADAGVTTP